MLHIGDNISWNSNITYITQQKKNPQFSADYTKFAKNVNSRIPSPD